MGMIDSVNSPNSVNSVISVISVDNNVNPFGTIGLTTAVFFVLAVLCWSRFFTRASHHDQSFYSTLFTYPK